MRILKFIHFPLFLSILLLSLLTFALSGGLIISKKISIVQAATQTDAMLSMTSDKSSYTRSDTITVDIILSPKTYKVTGAEIHLSYPSNLAFKTIETNSSLPVVLKSAQNTPGKLSFILGSLPTQPVTSSETVARITFTITNDSINPTTLSFDNSTIVTAFDHTENVVNNNMYPVSFFINPLPTASPTPTKKQENGLLGTYYNNKDFTGTAIERIDPQINFVWGYQQPYILIDADTYSVVWQGYIKPPQSQIYTFYARSDDGVRVWVDNTLLINNWNDQSAREKTGDILLMAEKKYPIRIEYYENYRNAVSQLLWSSPTLAKELIPSSNLFTP